MGVPYAVRIPPQQSRWPGFDLAEVMSVIGFHGDLRWRLKNAEFWLDTAPAAVRERWEAVEDQSRLRTGVELTWTDMEQLASDCSQVIDGTFTGFSGSLPHLQIAVIRGDEWIVWTADETVVSRVRGEFSGVTDYDEPEPSPLEIP
jgi:hypothetical protein